MGEDLGKTLNPFVKRFAMIDLQVRPEDLNIVLLPQHEKSPDVGQSCGCPDLLLLKTQLLLLLRLDDHRSLIDEVGNNPDVCVCVF